MRYTIINKKRYGVEYVLNMVGNFYFTDKHSVSHLVDGQDVQVWADEGRKKWRGIDTAIEYAKYISSISEDGSFWWKRKEL